MRPALPVQAVRTALRRDAHHALDIRTAGDGFPVLVRAPYVGFALASWLVDQRPEIERLLLDRGAILFRGFEIYDETAFAQVVAALSDRSMEYRERTSPRTRVAERIYTSTEYPAELPIFLHNESSYATIFPARLFFCCTLQPTAGGETPIAGNRGITARLPEEIKQRFRERGYRYVRNFYAHSEPSWQDVFQTRERSEVEAYCAATDISWEWHSGGGLRTWQTRPAFVRHWATGEELWFNHATFFHVSTLTEQLRTAVLAAYAAPDLPNNTYYGDGEPIEEETLIALRRAYHEATIAFPWQQGDVMVLDNQLVSHGRAPFQGQRRILVSLADPLRRRGFDVEWI